MNEPEIDNYMAVTATGREIAFAVIEGLLWFAQFHEGLLEDRICELPDPMFRQAAPMLVALGWSHKPAPRAT